MDDHKFPLNKNTVVIDSLENISLPVYFTQVYLTRKKGLADLLPLLIHSNLIRIIKYV